MDDNYGDIRGEHCGDEIQSVMRGIKGKWMGIPTIEPLDVTVFGGEGLFSILPFLPSSSWAWHSSRVKIGLPN